MIFSSVILMAFSLNFNNLKKICYFQAVDEDDFGGVWEIVKEGFMGSFASFLVS